MDALTEKILRLDMDNLTIEEVEWLHALKTTVQARICRQYIQQQKERAA